MREATISQAQQNGNGHSLVQTEVENEPVLAPNVDIFESEREILIDADFPGVAQDSLKVELEGTQLRIEGRQPGYGGRLGAVRLARTFRVPNTVDADRVQAELKSGVLRVRLPKREEAVPRRIAIRSAD